MRSVRRAITVEAERLHTAGAFLPALEARGIAAVTLDCMSCEIGNAASAFQDGVISAANQVAMNLGIQIGMTQRQALHLVIP